MSDASISSLSPPPSNGATPATGSAPSTARSGEQAAAFVLQLLALGVTPDVARSAQATAAVAGRRGGEGLPLQATAGAGPSRGGAALSPDTLAARALIAGAGSSEVANRGQPGSASGAATGAARAVSGPALARAGADPLDAVLAALAAGGDGAPDAADAVTPAPRSPLVADAAVPIAVHHPLHRHPAPTAVTAPAPSPAGPLLLTDDRMTAARVLAEHVAWQAGRGIDSAELRIRPAELGPLLVQVQVSDGEARVHFVAVHQHARDLVSDALPRLGQLLDAAGLQLADASVASQHRGGGHGGGAPAADPWLDAVFSESPPEPSIADPSAVIATVRGRALIDLFA